MLRRGWRLLLSGSVTLSRLNDRYECLVVGHENPIGIAKYYHITFRHTAPIGNCSIEFSSALAATTHDDDFGLAGRLTPSYRTPNYLAAKSGNWNGYI